jgi:regulatory protein YycI of two-component signal transduction system YycFG
MNNKKTTTAIVSAVGVAATVMAAKSMMKNKNKVKKTLKNAVDKGSSYVNKAIDKGSDYMNEAVDKGTDYLNQNVFK